MFRKFLQFNSNHLLYKINFINFNYLYFSYIALNILQSISPLSKKGDIPPAGHKKSMIACPEHNTQTFPTRHIAYPLCHQS